MANFGNQGGRKANVPAVPGTAALLRTGGFQIVEPRCKVCQSPHRGEIDLLLGTGWSVAKIVRHFNNFLGDRHFSRDSISRHADRHSSIEDKATRGVLEARARQEGIDVAMAEGFITTKAGVLDTIIQRGLEDLHKGNTTAEPKDVIQAIDMLQRFEAEWKEVAVDEMQVEFRLFMEAVKEIVGEEHYALVYDAFVRKLDERSGANLHPLPSPKSDQLELEAGELVAEEED